MGITPSSTILHPCFITALGTSPTHPRGQNSRSLFSSTLQSREYSLHVGMEVPVVSRKDVLPVNQGSSIHAYPISSVTHPFPLSPRATQHPTLVFNLKAGSSCSVFCGPLLNSPSVLSTHTSASHFNCGIDRSMK